MLRLDPRTLFESRDLSHDLARKSVRGGMTTMGAQGMKFVLQVAGTAILARLLTPADYGLVAMVTVIVNFAAMFKDAGLSMATVQKEKITHEQISTLFWINVMISAGLGLCILAASPLVAWFYGKPELTAVTAALSLSFLLSGLTIQHQALQRRHMRFGTLAAIQIASQLVTLVVTIILALLGWRYWALVGGTLANALVGSLFTFACCPWIPGAIKRIPEVRGMLQFGGHVSGANMVNYFSGNSDNILIGRFIGSDALGLYTKAYQLLMLPITQTRGPLQQVAVPILSSLRSQPDRYLRYFHATTEILAVLTMPLAIYCLIEAKFIIALTLGTTWLDAVPIFRVLAVSGVLRAITCTWGLVPLTYGLPDRFFKWGIANCIGNVAAMVIGLPFGILGVAIAIVVADYTLFLPCLFYNFRGTPVCVGAFLRIFLWPLLASGIAGGTLLAGTMVLGSSIKAHLIATLAFFVIYGALSFCRKPFRQRLAAYVKSVAVGKRNLFASKTTFSIASESQRTG